jgi:multidrug efflux pump subunit AcrB
MQFSKEKSIDMARFEVASIVRRVYDDFPKVVSYPSLSVGNNNNKEPLLTYTINAASNTNEIARQIKEKIEPEIARLKGIKSMELYGETPWEFSIEYVSEKLVVYNITSFDIINSINNYFSETPLGFAEINTGKQNYLRVVVQANAKQNLSWQNIPIKNYNGRIIYLTDITKVKYQEQSPQLLIPI